MWTPLELFKIVHFREVTDILLRNEEKIPNVSCYINLELSKSYLFFLLMYFHLNIFLMNIWLRLLEKQKLYIGER
jgi:hypothetical protein